MLKFVLAYTLSISTQDYYAKDRDGGAFNLKSLTQKLFSCSFRYISQNYTNYTESSSPTELEDNIMSTNSATLLDGIPLYQQRYT